MSNEICECGHSSLEHFDFIERLEKQMNRPYRQWVAEGLGKCRKSNCKEFRKKKA